MQPIIITFIQLYLVVSDILDDIEQIRARILSVGIEFELSLSPIGASASQNSASLSSFLVES
jgi:hypothetical protein